MGLDFNESLKDSNFNSKWKTVKVEEKPQASEWYDMTELLYWRKAIMLYLLRQLVNMEEVLANSKLIQGSC